MKEFFKSLFVKKDGDQRWTIQILAFLAITIFGVTRLWQEIITNFSERFLPQGLLTVIATIIAVFIWVAVNNTNKETGGSKGVARGYLIAVFIFWAGLFGTTVGLKQDRRDSIPDNAVYYFNGKVQNATDSTKKNYYFKEFSLNAEDSLYVVTYGEEPGYNKTNHVYVTDSTKSTAPRANEDWKRPVTKNAQKFKDGKRID